MSQPGDALPTGTSGPDFHPSTAAVAGHPIHPMLIPFPIAFLVGVVFTDLASLLTEDPFWARASVWLIGAGVISGVVAGAFGVVDFVTIKKARHVAMGWVHAVGNVAALVLAVVNWLIRLGESGWVVPGTGFLVSIVVAALLGVTGWAGGELAYRHRVGVNPHNRSAGR